MNLAFRDFSKVMNPVGAEFLTTQTGTLYLIPCSVPELSPKSNEERLWKCLKVRKLIFHVNILNI